ncbi:cysteine desulfurase family protein [Serinibacter salmoneus]|uniref:cysteine desulfurase n=1 Tax=Serinibacter salmoneus TaxID=556530 RepID=A0A2A9CYY3_9MICO|nr:cysteine desulfurase family protein [Serinibacter salmoneus]PFG19215.1 cysteine desulfurase [Serinibacter salmoneus]
MRLYLDEAATAPPRREVLEAMWPFLTARFGNPASVHEIGRDADAALEDARGTVARALGGRPGEIVFTSGGTEGANTAIKGIALASPRGRHVLVSAVEHAAVLESADWLGRIGYEVERLPVDATGTVIPEALAARLRPETTLVSVQLANNEVGTIQPVAELAALTREVGAAFHTDAVQAAGWLPIDVATLGVDALTLSGHKLGGPRGTGALWLRRGMRIEPLIHGGGQERGRRSGTVDVAGAVGLATALAAGHPGAQALAERRDAFIARVLDGVAPLIPDVALTGHATRRLPGHASFVLPGVNGEAVLLALEERGVVVSSGSACHAGSTEPSGVLTAMGLAPEVAQTAIRFSFGEARTAEELDGAARLLVEAVAAVTG